MSNHKYAVRRQMEGTATSDVLWIGGTPGSGLSDRDCFEVTKDGILIWRAAIHWELVCSPFQSQLIWKETDAILFGAHDEVYALALQTGTVLFHRQLGAYFGSFELGRSARVLFVFTGSEVLALDRQFEELWSTDGLAIDGVICHEIGEDFLTVEAEVDPPDGWQRVRLDARTGRELSREAII